MTDNSDIGEEDIEYIAMCYDGLGRADNGIDALLRMVQNCDRDFTERGGDVAVIFHKGRGNTVAYAHGQAMIDSEEKISENHTNIDVGLLLELERLHGLAVSQAANELGGDVGSGVLKDNQ